MSEELERKLRHELGNVKQEREALKSVIRKAADKMEKLVETDCDEEAKEEAQETADKLRKISKM